MYEGSWIEFALQRLPELWLHIGEHIMLTGLSTGMAIIIGIPLGICATRVWWLRGPLTGLVGTLQTIPSLAMLAILLTLLQKIGAVPAIITLTLYALLPIFRNTLAGLEGVSPYSLEAARGIGMTPFQQLWLVKLPLSMSVIMAGIRTAAVVNVGIATLSAFIGAGGLGQFINRGLALNNTRLILLGAIPAAVLALIIDGAIASFQWGIRRKRSRGTRFKATLDSMFRPVALAMPIVIIIMGCAAYFSPNILSGKQAGDNKTVSICTKNFTEQLILGELMAQLIESRISLSVQRRFNLGGTMICHGALKNGEIDIYAEYTGTALTTILKKPVIADPDQAYETVAREYRKRFAAEWFRPFGFNNTYAITVLKSVASSNNLRTISDLGKKSELFRAGFTAEFNERPDGYPGLARTYGLKFREVRDLEPTLMYEAIANGEVDVISAFATDGRILAFELQLLKDDLKFFPAYQAAPVVRIEVLQKYPELREVLNLLAGRLDEVTMQQINFKVDEGNSTPKEVARKFLEDLELLQ